MTPSRSNTGTGKFTSRLSNPTGDGGDQTGFNLGAIIDISEHNHILLSVGTDFHGPNLFSLYAAYQWTFGPTRLF